MPKSAQVKSDTKAIKVLVVEDDPHLGLNLARYVERHMGLPCSLARSLAEARAICASGERIDLVVMDMLLRDGCGIDLLHLLKQRGSKVIVTSGAVGNASAALVQQKGADAFLSKPFTLRDLGEQLVALMPPRRRKRSLDVKVSRKTPERRRTLPDLIKLGPVGLVILKELERNFGETVTYRDLYLKAFNAEPSYDDNRLRVWVHKIRKKIEDLEFERGKEIELATTWGKGYRLDLKSKIEADSKIKADS